MRATDLQIALRRLKSIDWDLGAAWTSQDLHDLHWYPATFPPQMPRLLVSLFSAPGAHVFDPFCGSGTTLLEAVKARRCATGVESNPLGAMIAKAKLLHCGPEPARKRLRVWQDRVHAMAVPPGLFQRQPPGDAAAERPDNQEQCWYHPDTYRELRELWTLCRRARGDVGRLLVCVFSALLKSACGQRRHWGYVADNMKPRKPEYQPAIELFERRLDHLGRQLELLAEQLSPWTAFEPVMRDSRVIAGDIRGLQLPSESVDLVVTSPPYAGVTDYVRAHRLSFEWLGWDLADPEACEIGARWKRFRQRATSDYLADMGRAFRVVFSALRMRGVCVLVIGQSRARDADREIMRSLLSTLSSLGLKEVSEPIARERSRQRLVNREAVPSTEEIYVLQKRRR